MFGNGPYDNDDAGEFCFDLVSFIEKKFNPEILSPNKLLAVANFVGKNPELYFSQIFIERLIESFSIFDEEYFSKFKKKTIQHKIIKKVKDRLIKLL